MCLSVYLSIYLSIYLCIYLSISLSRGAEAHRHGELRKLPVLGLQLPDLLETDLWGGAACPTPIV